MLRKRGNKNMKAKIYIIPKKEVLDPQGKAIVNALRNLGFSNVKDARQGKFIELVINATDKKAASELVTSMCEKLLVNTIIEDYSFEIIEFI